MQRDTIFIGHATPEDNEFTLWLQSKLINEGYKCECDLSFLIGGEADYWKNLQDFLTNNTAKYILVISSPTFNKQGVLDEWEHCRSIERQFNISDFIIPVKIDNSSYNARIGLNRRNIISFENNWGLGLKRVLKKLSHDDVYKATPNSLSIEDWYNNVYTNWSGIDKQEKDYFFSNWIDILEFPKTVFFHKYTNEDQAQVVMNNNSNFPIIRHGNILIGFLNKLDGTIAEMGFEIKPSKVFSKNTIDSFEYYSSEEFPTFQDYKRLLSRLLKECLESHLRKMELQTYGLANNTNCFYFQCESETHTKGRFDLLGMQKNITVNGKYFDSF